ncbi:MAG: DJ-1/PfpI family protein [Acidobacteriaceae bacterium]|jgi:cyclohexyl-isocyanide hydratase|nr:DJ-1/PfpI family protein [Acidobacteriaceae bacterium]
MEPRIGLLVFPHVQQLDLTGPYEVFHLAHGLTVDLVWKTREPVTSTTGLVFTPTRTFDDCPPLDVLCVPGGAGINRLLQDTATLEFIRRQAEGARFVTSVCTGSMVLAAAGLLEGKRATSHWAARDLLAAFGATPVAERVVRDGKFITAGGITSGIDFGLTVVAELLGQVEAETVQLGLEYAPHPPFDAGTPASASPDVVATARQRTAESRATRERIVGELRPEWRGADQ